MTDRDGHAQDLGPAVLEQLRDVVVQHDPEPIVIAVLTGSPARGLALSTWTAFEGEGADDRALELLRYATEADQL